MKRLSALPILLAACSVLAEAQSTGNAENGKKVFERMMCFSCHGHEGQGGGAGPRIGVKPPPLAGFLAYVRHPAGVMPPFTAKVVSDAELTDIHAYLSGRPAPPPLKDIPLLNQ
jgi:ubiquinol-cytochrome c reductase cytochrome c subunit